MDRRALGARVLGAAGLVVVCLASGVVLRSPEPDGAGAALAASAAAAPAATSSRSAAADLHRAGDPASSSAAPTGVTAPAAGALTAPENPSVAQDSSAPVTGSTSSAPSGHTAGAKTDAATMPAIPPSPVTHVSIPAIGVNAQVLPVDSVPTGKKNAWGGEVYQQINFPVDDAARQWVRRGDPNSLPAKESEGDVKAFDRVMIYGHASDIGYHLVFQDLSALRPGQSIVVDTAKGRFSYRVTTVTSSQKADLAEMAQLYEYPTGGRKQIALIACLPDTTLNTVVLGELVGAASR